MHRGIDPDKPLLMYRDAIKKADGCERNTVARLKVTIHCEHSRVVPGCERCLNLCRTRNKYVGNVCLCGVRAYVVLCCCATFVRKCVCVCV